jgi:hypothetical protein
MKRLFSGLLCVAALSASAQESPKWQGKFEQLGQLLPTPNEYRTGSGSPGPAYWQQRADYVIDVELNDENQSISGKETVKYYNNSPDILRFLWLQVDQNILDAGRGQTRTTTSTMKDSVAAKKYAIDVSDFKGQINIQKVTDLNGRTLPWLINNTMMRVDLSTPLRPGESTSLQIEWNLNINDRQVFNERSGYEFFPQDGNYLYTMGQFFPRMCVYDDYEGWQNKQFIGQGEFALTFGNYVVRITVPSDHIVAATGILHNPQEVLSARELEKFQRAQKSFDRPVTIVTEAEAIQKEKSRSSSKKTWEFRAENVRDFAFASSRKFIWDAQAVKLGSKAPMAMAFYPREGNPLWNKDAITAVKNTLEVYSRYTIDYPYPVAIAVHAAVIAMEYPMISFDRGRPTRDGKVTPAIRQSMVGAIVHEVGHNFFPMIINSDERQSTWMDEGLNSFIQLLTELERYPDSDFKWTRGVPRSLIPYMKGSPGVKRPLMINSEQVIKFADEQYAKAATGLFILRETVMGHELFDKAFKEYAQRWAFKHPKPADFFRTMEDASAVDLDWFWRGWFYSTDACDISIDKIKWFRLRDSTNLNDAPRLSDQPPYQSFDNGPDLFSLTEGYPGLNGEFLSAVNSEEIISRLQGKNFYEITLSNKGGLIMPVILEWTFSDGTQQTEHIPAEIWRVNETKATKVFIKEKEVLSVTLDPKQETVDVDDTNNSFPRKNQGSKFDQFKKRTD